MYTAGREQGIKINSLFPLCTPDTFPEDKQVFFLHALSRVVSVDEHMGLYFIFMGASL